MYESFAYLKICANTQATYNSYDTCLFPSWVMWTLELNYKHIKGAECCMMSSSEDILWEHGNVNIIYSNSFFHVSQVVTGSSTVSSREKFFFLQTVSIHIYILYKIHMEREKGIHFLHHHIHLYDMPTVPRHTGFSREQNTRSLSSWSLHL